MGFFSRKQDQSSAAEQPVRRSRARRTPNLQDDNDDPLDPALLQKKRARRRVVGAITLAIAAVVFLPMVLDSEPQPLGEDLTVELPAKTSPFNPKSSGAPGAASAPGASVTKGDASSLATPGAGGGSVPAGSSDKPTIAGVYSSPAPLAGDGSVGAPASKPAAPATPVPSGAPAPAAGAPSPAVPGATTASPGASTGGTSSSALPAGKSVTPVGPASASTSTNLPSNAPSSAATNAPAAKADTSAKSEEKAARKAEPASAAKSASAAKTSDAKSPDAAKASSAANKGASAEQQRAQAILDGKATPDASSAPKKGSTGPFAVQIGAFASTEKVQELVSKLGAAGMRTYTEKLATPQGERTRVRLGPFATREEAQKSMERAKGMGLDGSLVTP
jgi:DedD protein